MDIIEQIKERLKAYPNKQFAIIVNGDIVNMGNKNRTILARVKYRKDSHKEELILGYCKHTNKRVVLVNDSATVDKIVELLSSTTYADVDLGNVVRNNSIEIGIDINYAVIYITSGTYRVVKTIALQATDIMPQVSDKSGKPLSSGTVRILYDTFIADAIGNYHNVVRNIVYSRVLKREASLKFYFMIDSFIPINIYSGSNGFLFNPFIHIPNIMKSYSQSLLYQISLCTTKTCKGLTINFATPTEICKGFGLNKYVRFTLDFFIDVLGGIYSPLLPNPSTTIYVLKYKADYLEGYPLVMTEEEFYNNLSMASGEYLPTTSLEQLCFEYARSLKVPKDKMEEFSSMMSKRRLVKAGVIN